MSDSNWLDSIIRTAGKFEGFNDDEYEKAAEVLNEIYIKSRMYFKDLLPMIDSCIQSYEANGIEIGHCLIALSGIENGTEEHKKIGLDLISLMVKKGSINAAINFCLFAMGWSKGSQLITERSLLIANKITHTDFGKNVPDELKVMLLIYQGKALSGMEFDYEKKNYQEGYKLLIEAGTVYNDKEALYIAGVMTEDKYNIYKLNIEDRYVMAKMYYRLGMLSGCHKCMAMLGILYFTEKCEEGKYEYGMRLIIESAKHGEFIAASWLSAWQMIRTIMGENEIRSNRKILDCLYYAALGSYKEKSELDFNYMENTCKSLLGAVSSKSSELFKRIKSEKITSKLVDEIFNEENNTDEETIRLMGVSSTIIQVITSFVYDVGASEGYIQKVCNSISEFDSARRMLKSFSKESLISEKWY